MLKIFITADSRYPFDRKRVRSEIISEAERHIDIEGENYWVNLVVCGRRKIRFLNLKYRQIDEVTDVLSFPVSDSAKQVTKGFVHPAELGAYMGDIAVCYPVAREYAAKRNKLVVVELAFLARHGVQHLMGVHH